jgi:CO/xanthine dehydrogenase FAD-binding subunit
MVLAGGTDLVTMRAQGQIAPVLLVDVKHIGGLNAIETRADAIHVGASTTMAALVAASPSGIDAVLDGARLIGSSQIRNRATIVGNVARASPAGDTLPGLLVHGATVLTASDTGARTIPITEFWTGPGQTTLASAELITGLMIPRGSSASAYARMTYRAWMDLAVVGVAARLDLSAGMCTGAAIALGGAAPTPFLIASAAGVLVGSRVETGAIAEAADLVAAAARPISDVRGSAEFRRNVIRPLAARVIARALDRGHTFSSR